MANVSLTIQRPTDAGLTTTRNAIATGNTYKVRLSDKPIFLNFMKSGAGAATITLTTQKAIGALAVADRTVNVPATTGDVLVGPFVRSVYADASGDLNFTTDEGTGLDCAVIGA